MSRGQLSRVKVLRAAIDLVDELGLGALSMRRLGERLGVEAMSLYRYVKGKEDLLNGVHGAILEEMDQPPPGGNWQHRLRKMANSFRLVLSRHPHALPLFASRPAVTSSSRKAVEASLAVLEKAGFTPVEQVHAFHTIVGFVVGTAFLHFGLDDDAYVDDALQASEYPRLNRAISETFNIEKEFAFGLDALLDGLQTRARKRRGKRGPVS